MKIETFEESAEKWVFETNGHKWSNNDDSAGDNYGSFIAGFKCCQEQTYSNMQEYAEFCIRCYEKKMPCIIAKDWFKQFKKK